MSCFERARLEKAYEDARASFDFAAEQLERRIAVSSRDEYEQLKREESLARSELYRANQLLRHHICEHGCETA
jgi:uncharacterized membrane-anchored protein